MKTVNPFKHPFPHAKLRNITLTSISRLSRGSVGNMIENDDVRNFPISRADELAKQYGYRAPLAE